MEAQSHVQDNSTVMDRCPCLLSMNPATLNNRQDLFGQNDVITIKQVTLKSHPLARYAHDKVTIAVGCIEMN